ncbi:unnamed protein product [Ilex paraguariensis]|uniref:Uncharacterized protein n=1 Tax=Ilex paraguariensis TaxID=185542 RepID=A0ABC8RVR6_9AQUA
MPKIGGHFPKFMPSSSSSSVLHSHRDSNFLHSEADITEFFTATEFYSHNHCHCQDHRSIARFIGYALCHYAIWLPTA